MATVKLINSGFRTLRKSAPMVNLLTQKAEQIVAGCGAGYGYQVAPSKNRARVTVFPDTPDAERENAKSLTLLRNLDRGRD